MYYGAIKKNDITDGIGIRVSLFVSGCCRHCKGCFQPETWDFKYGQPFTQSTVSDILEYLKPSYINGLSILGGEPFEPQNQLDIFNLLLEVRKRYPNKSVWIYSGYTFEQLTNTAYYMEDTYAGEILYLSDVLVDGPFIQEQKNLMLAFRGSENQRIIDLKETRTKGKIVLLAGV